MPRWSMVIDLDKCVGCQGCTLACRMENNTPYSNPDQSAQGRTILWNEVFPYEGEGEYPNVHVHIIPRPCMHCDNPPCIKVCPVQATFIDEEGLVRQNYTRCIGCRFCTVACPYGVRYFNWYEPRWDEQIAQHLNPDVVNTAQTLEGPVPRPKGIVEKCTYCVHRLQRARQLAEEEGRAFRAEDYVPACVQTCTAKARFFGDTDVPRSTVSQLLKSGRAFRIQEEVGTYPKTVYLREG